MNRQISLLVVFSVLWSTMASYANSLFCAVKFIISLWFWRIYGPFILPFMKVYSDAARVSFELTICGVQNVVFPSLYGNVKQDGRMKSHWWLVDSGAGRSMSSNIEDFIYLEPWTGGKVQVGSGEIMDVTHRGIIQLYARGRDGTPVSIPEFREAWYVPGLAFKILSVSDIADGGMAVRFGERGSIKDYVYIHDTGVKCKLGKFKGVYVLKTVDVSQVAAAHKVETKRVIEPKLHVDTDLWYYFGRKSPPNTGGIVVKDDGISQYCGRSPMPAIACKVIHMFLLANSRFLLRPFRLRG